ncbi:MAG TPA: zinc-ribbon domain-containing protein [Propionibacteriaceae bacterium]
MIIGSRTVQTPGGWVMLAAEGVAGRVGRNCERGRFEMLIIGFGVTEILLSTLVFTCETCGNHGAHQLTKQNRRFSLFFIPLFSVGTKYLDSCTACGRIIEVSKVQAEAAARQVGPDLR